MPLKFGLGDEFEIQPDGSVPALGGEPSLDGNLMPEELRRKVPRALVDPLPPQVLDQSGGRSGGRNSCGPAALIRPGGQPLGQGGIASDPPLTFGDAGVVESAMSIPAGVTAEPAAVLGNAFVQFPLGSAFGQDPDAPLLDTQDDDEIPDEELSPTCHAVSVIIVSDGRRTPGIVGGVHTTPPMPIGAFGPLTGLRHDFWGVGIEVRIRYAGEWPLCDLSVSITGDIAVFGAGTWTSIAHFNGWDYHIQEGVLAPIFAIDGWWIYSPTPGASPSWQPNRAKGSPLPGTAGIAHREPVPATADNPAQNGQVVIADAPGFNWPAGSAESRATTGFALNLSILAILTGSDNSLEIDQKRIRAVHPRTAAQTEAYEEIREDLGNFDKDYDWSED